MTQIKIFTETTYSNPADKKAMTTGGLEKKVNGFLAENEGKISVKDIKYSIQSPNPHQILNLSVQHWTVIVIYDEYERKQTMKEKEMKKSFDIDEFLVEIGRAPLLSDEEERGLIKAIQKLGSECKEMEKLVESNRRFVVSVAAQYRNQGLSFEELIEAGTGGLRIAAQKYNTEEADFKFIPYAVWWIRQQIIQKLNEKD